MMSRSPVPWPRTRGGQIPRGVTHVGQNHGGQTGGGPTCGGSIRGGEMSYGLLTVFDSCDDSCARPVVIR